MGFALLAEATLAGSDSVAASLLLRTLTYLQPAAVAPLTGAVVPVHLRVANAGETALTQAVITLPAETRLVESQVTHGVVTYATDEDIAWRVNLAAGVSASATLWLRLPDAPGPIDLDVALQAGHGDALTEQDRLSLTVDVEQRPGLIEVLANLEILAEQSKVYRMVEQRLENAERALSEDNVDKAVTELVRAAVALIRIGTVEAEAMRAAVGEALRQVAQKMEPL